MEDQEIIKEIVENIISKVDMSVMKTTHVRKALIED